VSDAARDDDADDARDDDADEDAIDRARARCVARASARTNGVAVGMRAVVCRRVTRARAHRDMDTLRKWAGGYADVGETHQVRATTTTRERSTTRGDDATRLG
jgi:hypothetical protein